MKMKELATIVIEKNCFRKNLFLGTQKVYLEKSEVSKESIRKTGKLGASQRERLKSHDKSENMLAVKLIL